MGIRKTIAAIIAAAMVLSMTACANNEKPNNNEKTNNGGATTNSNSSSTNKIFGIEDDVPEPPKQTSMWDVIPEIPVTDASAFTYKYDSELGGMVVTDYLRESPKVRIPDTLEGEPVVSVNFSKCSKEITQLVMPDSVKEFELSYTTKCSLQYVNIPKSVTKIDAEIFRNNSNLISVYITDGTTEINMKAFSGCKQIKVAYKGETYVYEHIQDLYDAINFGEDGMLIEDGRLKDVSQKFTEITIPDSVTEIGGRAFSGCKDLTSVTIPDSVTKIGGGSLSSDGAFSGCTGLTSVTIGNGVTTIGSHAFFGCTGLTSITIPNNVTEIGKRAFDGCTGLTSVTIPDSVTEIVGGTFSGCTGLTSVTIPDSVTTIGGGGFSDDGAFSGCTGLTSVTIGNGVTTIGSHAFFGCTGLTSVTIPDSVTVIVNSAFNGCEGLTSVTYKGKTYDYEHIDDLYAAINGE